MISLGVCEERLMGDDGYQVLEEEMNTAENISPKIQLAERESSHLNGGRKE